MRTIVSLGSLAAGCGSEDDAGGDSSAAGTVSDEAAVTATATSCVTGEGDPNRTITLGIDDVVGGSGGISSQTPSDLTAGSVRISVEADAENEGPIEVTVARDGTSVATISGVDPGATCGIDVDLEPGNYQATSNVTGDSDAGFVVIP